MSCVAPTERAAEVGNVVKTKFPSIMGVPVPSFLARALNMDVDSEEHFAVGEIVLDDECYLGKNGDLKDCADFDPPVTP